MEQVKIYVPDIECESCTKLLTKRFEQAALKSFVFQEDGVLCECEHPAEIVKVIQDAGFRASLHPFVRKKFRERFREAFQNKAKYALEWKMVRVWCTLIATLGIIEWLAYFFLFKSIPDFLPKYG